MGKTENKNVNKKVCKIYRVKTKHVRLMPKDKTPNMREIEDLV